MMISSDLYREEQKNKTYNALLIEREKLLKQILRFENNLDNEVNDKFIMTDPSPDVFYYYNLQYLSELCILIAEKYNEEHRKWIEGLSNE